MSYSRGARHWNILKFRALLPRKQAMIQRAFHPISHSANLPASLVARPPSPTNQPFETANHKRPGQPATWPARFWRTAGLSERITLEPFLYGFIHPQADQVPEDWDVSNIPQRCPRKGSSVPEPTIQFFSKPDAQRVRQSQPGSAISQPPNQRSQPSNQPRRAYLARQPANHLRSLRIARCWLSSGRPQQGFIRRRHFFKPV